MKYLKLQFSGVLQYFASNDSSVLRKKYTTDFYPTKSAVIGLISAAFGFQRGDFKIIELSNKLDIKYKSLNSNTTILEDFQTIRPLKSQSYYMNKFYNRNRVKQIDGRYKIDSNGNDAAIIKNVQYLQEAEFEVYIGGDEKLLKEIYDAIRNPVYALYLGKRSCVPNKPIVTVFELINKEDLSNVYDCA